MWTLEPSNNIRNDPCDISSVPSKIVTTSDNVNENVVINDENKSIVANGNVRKTSQYTIDSNGDVKANVADDSSVNFNFKRRPVHAQNEEKLLPNQQKVVKNNWNQPLTHQDQQRQQKQQQALILQQPGSINLIVDCKPTMSSTTTTIMTNSNVTSTIVETQQCCCRCCCCRCKMNLKGWKLTPCIFMNVKVTQFTVNSDFVASLSLSISRSFSLSFSFTCCLYYKCVFNNTAHAITSGLFCMFTGTDTQQRVTELKDISFAWLVE